MKTLRRRIAGMVMGTLLLLGPVWLYADEVAAVGRIEVLFPPYDDATGAIVAAIDDAQSEVLVQAYVFTSFPIAAALAAARRRGCAVKVLMDKEMAASTNREIVRRLLAARIEVRLEDKYLLAHNKVMIIDGAGEHPLVITGSFNFTVSAQTYNAENLLLLRDNQPLAQVYRANWQSHYRDSRRLPQDDRRLPQDGQRLSQDGQGLPQDDRRLPQDGQQLSPDTVPLPEKHRKGATEDRQ